MGMQPDSRELLRLSAEINLDVKKIRYRLIVKFDADSGYFLLDRNELSYEKQIICLGNTETTDFVVGFVSKIQKLCPCCGAESKGNVASLNSPA
ncbi:MAG: hypothetical protein ACYTDV_21465 [Planctomycetota bacterium]|jgi:hypothetical protein